MNFDTNFELDLNVMHSNKFPNNSLSNSYMNCLYFNAQSLRNKFTELQDFIINFSNKIDVILITETWLQYNEKQYYNLINYQSFHSTRLNGTGGGVSIFVHNNFDIGNIVFEESVNNNNIIIISLLKQNLHLALFYRQPNNSLDSDYGIFFNKLDLILNSYKNIYCFGDFNVNILAKSPQVSKYLSIVKSNGLNFLNSFSDEFPTRISSRNNSSSSIDHIFTDHHYYDNTISHKFFLYDYFGDHRNIFLSISKSQRHQSNDLKYKITRVNNERIQKLKLLDTINVSSFDEYVKAVSNVISSNTHQYPSGRNPKKPYVNHNTIKLITIRNKYMRLKAKFPDCEDFISKFKQYRQLIKKQIASDKINYYNKKFEDNLMNPRKTWQIMNNLLYNKIPSPTPAISLLKVNGIPISKPEAIASNINTFFTCVADVIINQIAPDPEDFKRTHDNENYLITHDFACPRVTEDEISLIIDNLKSSNACDYYGISNNFVKLHKSALVSNLTQLVNKYMFEGDFPDSLKLGIVTPIFKTGDRTDRNNYRPITVNPIFSKIFEYCILRRFNDHLNNNHIIHPNQFGCVEKSNTEISAAHVLHEIYNGIEERKATALTCIDLTKAYDSIQHQVLIMKLRKLNLDPFFLNLLISYLERRKQAVKVGTILSPFLPVTSGTPQGGVLSGAFFNLYINSIFKLQLNSQLMLYCDDASLISKAPDHLSLKSVMEADLNLISIWLNCHYLLPNINKTKYVLFHGRKKFEHFTEAALNINFNNLSIERVEFIKLLGLIIDEGLSFRNQVESVENKIIPFTYALRRIRKLITDKLALDLYYAHVQSHLIYMAPLWACIPQYLMASIECIQRKALRVVLNKPWYCSSSELYNEKLLPVSVMCKVNSVLLVAKIKSNNLKSNIIIQTASSQHNHLTRYKENFTIPNLQSSLSRQDFYFHAFNAYNSLPVNIKNIFSLSIKKNRLREYYLEIYNSAVS